MYKFSIMSLSLAGILLSSTTLMAGKGKQPKEERAETAKGKPARKSPAQDLISAQTSHDSALTNRGPALPDRHLAVRLQAIQAGVKAEATGPESRISAIKIGEILKGWKPEEAPIALSPTVKVHAKLPETYYSMFSRALSSAFVDEHLRFQSLSHNQQIEGMADHFDVFDKLIFQGVDPRLTAVPLRTLIESHQGLTVSSEAQKGNKAKGKIVQYGLEINQGPDKAPSVLQYPIKDPFGHIVRIVASFALSITKTTQDGQK